jgi:hypothetical protein
LADFGSDIIAKRAGIALRLALRAETRNAMQQLGAPSLKELTPAMVRRV